MQNGNIVFGTDDREIYEAHVLKHDQGGPDPSRPNSTDAELSGIEIHDGQDFVAVYTKERAYALIGALNEAIEKGWVQ